MFGTLQQCVEFLAELEGVYVAKSEVSCVDGSIDEANELLCELFKENPQNAEAISILGLIFYHQRNLKKSVEVFNNALQIDPNLNDAKVAKENALKFMAVLSKSKFYHVDLYRKKVTKICFQFRSSQLLELNSQILSELQSKTD
jgi:tetratricopeptide (TPR) repeat protein